LALGAMAKEISRPVLKGYEALQITFYQSCLPENPLLRFNLTLLAGGIVIALGVLDTGFQIASGGVGGGVFGAVLTGPLLLIFGLVLVILGSRSRRRFSRR
jgi:hypothetical protein